MQVIVLMRLQQQQSVQMLLGKKAKPKRNKSKNKRTRTFTSSEFSLPDDHARPTSACDLLKNDPISRRRVPQGQSQGPALPAHPVKKNRSVKQLQATTKKRGKSRSRGRLQKCETYEVIPYKNSLNSEIVFSNQETRREGSFEESSSELAIRVNQQYLLDNNRLLRISIRKEYLRKVDAAIKIQKVFRGYLTRKVLQNCIDNHHQKLNDRLLQIRSQSVSEHSSYFAEKENMMVEPRRRPVIHHQPDSEQEDEEQEEEAVVYRHHQPIYSHDEISAYLDSSEQEDFDRDAFDNHIIFETNEEYIESRKSSQQPQPKSKLSRPQATIVEEPLDSPVDPPPHEVEPEILVKTQKKQERIKTKLEQLQVQAREETLRLKEETVRASAEDIPLEQCSPTRFVEGEATLNRREDQNRSVQRMKEEELQRWEEVIELVQAQISRSQDNSEMGTFMQRLMELSLKNKQSLEASIPPSPSNSSLSHRNDSRGKLKTLRAQRQYLTQEQPPPSSGEKIEKPLFFDERQWEQRSNAAANPMSPTSSFDTTGQLKRFLQDNVHDQHIEEMLKLRQELLQKRYEDDVRKLSQQLANSIFSQEEFQIRLDSVQKKYDEQRACIQRSRDDITRGHRAALKLTRQAATDAKKLGYELPVSRSVQGLRFKSPLLMPDIVVDEMGRRDKKPIPSLAHLRQPEERIHVDIQSEQSSDLQFTEEELRRFRRAQPYDIELAEEIADLGRNVLISEQLLRQQQAQENQLMTTQLVSRQIYEIEQASPARPAPLHDALCEWLFNLVAWEAAAELMVRPAFAERLVDRSHLLRPQPVNDKERLKFLSLLESRFPAKEVLNAKLNQKICPLPGQLLRCMRIDFSQDDEDDNSYQQIGKYEFIIGQEVCNQAIREFRAGIDSTHPPVTNASQEVQRIGKEWCLGERVVRYVQQREKYLSSRRSHTRQLRWEVLNIEVHCLFDAWNEEIIFLRSQKAGYSGIGLNELTLSVRDHNWHVPRDQTLSIINEGKKRLLRTLALSSPTLLFPQVVEEDEEELLEVDSKWIFYADEALSYGLQLVYLIEQEVFSECAKELRRRMLHF